MMDTAIAARAVGGFVIGVTVPFQRVTTDTRGLIHGDLFVALKGERFDGHDFVARALDDGAAAALVGRQYVAAVSENLIVVDDPLHALATLARFWRSRFDIPLAVVTGSNGKTTTKEMIAAIFRAAAGDAAVAATPGNFNNAIGLPLALLALRATHELAVFEIGMNHRGETRELGAIAEPTIAVITNAQREHQEFMRSVDEVAAEHADAIHALREGGVAVVNADDARANVWREAAAAHAAQVLTFGLDNAADVTARYDTHEDGCALELRVPEGSARVVLHAPGRHMARNALAAAAVACAARLPTEAIVRGLERFRPVGGRLAVTTTHAGFHVIDDSHNANPDSVRAAIDVLASRPPPRWLVLGDMDEVGDDGPAFHAEIGAYARVSGIERMLVAGTLSRDTTRAFGAGGEHFDSVEALADRIARVVRAGVTVLVKGSRFMRMERVVAALTGNVNGGSH